MTIQELEQQLLSLDPAEKLRLIQLLSESLTAKMPIQKTEASLVEFFRNSPLCEVADELELSRDKSLFVDRVHL
jgi:hypothetical protein